MRNGGPGYRLDRWQVMFWHAPQRRLTTKFSMNGLSSSSNSYYQKAKAIELKHEIFWMEVLVETWQSGNLHQTGWPALVAEAAMWNGGPGHRLDRWQDRLCHVTLSASYPCIIHRKLLALDIEGSDLLFLELFGRTYLSSEYYRWYLPLSYLPFHFSHLYVARCYRSRVDKCASVKYMTYLIMEYREF